MVFNGFLVYETHLQEPNEDHECLKKILQYFFLNKFVSVNSLFPWSAQDGIQSFILFQDEAEAGKGSDFLRDIGSIALYQILKGPLWGMRESTG